MGSLSGVKCSSILKAWSGFCERIGNACLLFAGCPRFRLLALVGSSYCDFDFSPSLPYLRVGWWSPSLIPLTGCKVGLRTGSHSPAWRHASTGACIEGEKFAAHWLMWVQKYFYRNWESWLAGSRSNRCTTWSCLSHFYGEKVVVIRLGLSGEAFG